MSLYPSIRSSIGTKVQEEKTIKNLKKLTRDQKAKLSKKGIDPTKYLLKTFDHKTFTVRSREPDEHGTYKEMTFNN